MHSFAKQRTIKSVVDEHASRRPLDVFFISAESGRRINYLQLQESLSTMATATSVAGEVVGAMVGNGWAATRLLLGLPYHGRVATLFNLAAGDSQIAYMMAHSGCKIIFADDENFLRAEKIVNQLENGRRINLIKINRDDGVISSREIPAFAGMTMDDDAGMAGDNAGMAGDGDAGMAGDGGAGMADDGVAKRVDKDAEVNGALEINPRQHALLIYTSGTTGKPKGVLHSHKSLLAGGANTVLAHRLTAADRALCVLPLFHINGQCVTVFAPLLCGGSVVVPRKFSARYFWRWLADNECTWFSVVPTIVSHLLHGAESDFISPRRLRFGRSASSPLAADIHRRFEKQFGVVLVETMGLTETAAQILANPLPRESTIGGGGENREGEKEPRPKTGAAGIAFGNEVTVLDERGDINPPMKVGEIAVRGDNVMSGYLRDAAATAAAFNKDGWLLSGDLGYCDADGYFFITGRRKELIIKGGENIAPREIDDVLYSAAGVVEAAAFAVPCKVYGQRVMAAVVAKTGDDGKATVGEKELIALCEERIGKFKSPQRIFFLPSLPKGPSGKIQRLALADSLRDKLPDD